MKEDHTCSEDEWQACLKVLELLDRDIEIPQEREPLEILISRLHRKIRKRIRKESFESKKSNDKSTLAQTSRVQNSNNESMVAIATEPARAIEASLERPDKCYICQDSFRNIHFHYHRLCPGCAKFNYAKRTAIPDVKGRTALVTGARIKIGYQTSLRLLRGGANVITTTRFPRDAAIRYSQEEDFDEWRNRLTIHPLDLRDIPYLMDWVEQLGQNRSIDILINNAAQTVWRPQEHYARQLSLENSAGDSIPDNLKALIANTDKPENRLTNSAALVQQQISSCDIRTDFHEPIDRRETTSWDLKLHEVNPVEFLEVQLINVTAPFVLSSLLKPSMMRSTFKNRFIINVTGKDGRFDVDDKTTRHPHVNMSKAALNMMTRTSAEDYASSNIFMNTVDTGWITLEGGYSRTQNIKKSGFVPPLDAVDGAARICDPISSGICGEPQFGKFLKDYRSVTW